MLVLEAQRIAMQFNGKLLFKVDDLRVHSGDRIGLVGPNGAGKTTLLTVLAGLREPASGSVRLHSSVAYIPQLGDGEGAESLLEEQRAYWGIPLSARSGGEQTRLKIARALGRESGLLLCDEPTSNLDEEGTRKLEDALGHYLGALVIVSHDRALLDRLCARIWELEEGVFTVWKGNYSAWHLQKAEKRKREEALYEVCADEKRHLEHAAEDRSRLAASMKKAPARMGNSEARLHKLTIHTKQAKVAQSAAQIKNRLIRLEEVKKPREIPGVRMQAQEIRGPVSRTAVLADHLTYAYVPGKPVLLDVSFILPTGARAAVTGPNGSGKTTLLRCVHDRATGVRVAPGARIGYFAQDLSRMDDKMTALEYASQECALPQSEARTVLARLGLRRDEAHKKTGVLSGGERCRVRLARLLLGQFPLLLLDEPTNYLDLYAMEALEDMLLHFGGTLLFVSHDRYFREKVATCSFEMHQGRLIPSTPPAAPASAPGAQRMILELEKARLISRLSAPGPGDRPDELEARYREVCERIRAMDSPI